MYDAKASTANNVRTVWTRVLLILRALLNPYPTTPSATTPRNASFSAK